MSKEKKWNERKSWIGWCDVCGFSKPYRWKVHCGKKLRPIIIREGG